MTEPGSPAGEQPPRPLAMQPGWYPDPGGSPGYRYWDGASWTTAYADGQPPGMPPQRSRSMLAWVVAAAAVALLLVVTAALFAVIVRGGSDEAAVEPSASATSAPSPSRSAPKSSTPSATAPLPAPTLTRAPEPTSVSVIYFLTVAKSCSDTDTGFDDIDQGTEVEVFDGAGNLLGFGNLGKGSKSDGKCSYTAEFPVQVSPDGLYRVTAGSDSRGFLNFRESDLVDGTLLVMASLGD